MGREAAATRRLEPPGERPWPHRRRLGRFELLRELGRGAQASVWLAHDPRLDREVALKLLTRRRRRRGEPVAARGARRQPADHPNIVPVFEADEHEGQSYLVFEYVDGPHAGRRAARRRPCRRARRWS
jgi:serine/threonine protein kinase